MLKKNTQILLGVFALLMIVFLILQNLPEKEPVLDEVLPTQAILATLFDFAAEDVVGFRIEDLEGQAVHFALEDGAWIAIQPPASAEETDTLRLLGLIPQLSQLRLVTETILDSPLNVFGLDEPAYILNIFLLSGEEHELQIGGSSITNTGYYVSLDNGSPQLVTESILDQFIQLIANPPLIPTPFPTESLDPTDPITDTLSVTPEDVENPGAGSTETP